MGPPQTSRLYLALVCKTARWPRPALAADSPGAPAAIARLTADLRHLVMGGSNRALSWTAAQLEDLRRQASQGFGPETEATIKGWRRQLAAASARPCPGSFRRGPGMKSAAHGASWAERPCQCGPAVDRLASLRALAGPSLPRP